MAWEPLVALREAAAEGVAFDGLRARLDGDTLFLEVEGSRTALDDQTRPAVPETVVPYVTNWYYWQELAPERPAERTFLRWLECATDDGEHSTVLARYRTLAAGIERTWGQLRITTTLAADDTRRYEIRHVDDADRPRGGLEICEGRDAAEDLARYDDRGRYRPLKTAPTLRSGWVVPDLGPEAVLSVVAELYPATVENWWREREGDLDVTHYRAVAERQTGRYRAISELPSEALEWAVEACCVDSQCLKRREWDEADDRELAVPRGEGKFPCREPCSLFVAAAKEWTDLEREKPRTYEFELTPSEKAQLEAIVDAVAEGRVEEIREATLDEGANRYRARYLRAKRFENGTLPDTADDPGDDR